MTKYNVPCLDTPKPVIDNYKTPCVWKIDTTTHLDTCQPCSHTLKDPESQNIYCFVDKKNKSICQHSSYKPNKVQCTTTLGGHCEWKGGQCIPK